MAGYEAVPHIRVPVREQGHLTRYDLIHGYRDLLIKQSWNLSTAFGCLFGAVVLLAKFGMGPFPLLAAAILALVAGWNLQEWQFMEFKKHAWKGRDYVPYPIW
ncbi:MAG: hypothetical protein HY394_05470 [Candidatus Diapherotrites archaeon]|nr:hypothetical protein [Candidatus Diapherotrites archaeon]